MSSLSRLKVALEKNIESGTWLNDTMDLLCLSRDVQWVLDACDAAPGKLGNDERCPVAVGIRSKLE